MNVQLDYATPQSPFYGPEHNASERPFVGLLGRKSSLMAQLGMKLKISQGALRKGGGDWPTRHRFSRGVTAARVRTDFLDIVCFQELARCGIGGIVRDW